MTFDSTLATPRDGHELTCVSLHDHVYWCLRCGALWLGSQRGARWEAPGQAGRSHASDAAPPCLISTDEGAANPSADARLMLLALTRGWRCDRVHLKDAHGVEGWRWSHDGPLGGEAWSVVGAWADGPLLNEPIRRLLLTSID